MGYLSVNPDDLAAYGTCIFLMLDVIALVLIGVFSQRISAASAETDIDGDEKAHSFHLAVSRCRAKHRDIVVATSDGRQ